MKIFECNFEFIAEAIKIHRISSESLFTEEVIIYQ